MSKRSKRVERLLRAAIKETDAEEKALPEAEKPKETFTVFCVNCDSDLWEVPNADHFRAEDVTPIGHKVHNTSSLLIHCPFCHTQVFDRRYYGGWEFSTREVGRFPGGNRCNPGVRIPSLHPSPFAR